MELKVILDLIEAINFVFTAAVALKIYYMQRTDSTETGRREAQVRLTQAYFQFSVEILHSKNMIDIMRELIYAPNYNARQVERIELMFMMLNTLYLEWHSYKDHSHSEEAFQKTLESWMKPLPRNVKNDPQNRFLIDDFEKIFVDFPDEFKATVLNCIKSAD